MKITMICIGSMGDVRPYMLLGRELKSRGHEVTVAAFDAFRPMLEAAGLHHFSLSGDVVAFMNSIMKPGATGVRYLAEVEKAIRDIAPVLLSDLMRSCESAEALICTFFGSMYYSIAEKYRIPVIQTQYFPMDPNRDMPISSSPFQHLGKAWNSASYKLGYLLIGALEKRFLSDWRREHGMAPRKIQPRPDYVSDGHTVPVIYAVSPRVMPRPESWGEHIYMSGFWYDDQPVDYTPPKELVDFLNAGEPPVYIGFGSMVSGNMNRTFARVLRAVRASKVRAVIAGGWAGGGEEVKVTRQICFVKEVPHDWLFPRVSAVVHHGGAGTTAAGLRHGKPTLVVPFGGDQPFWGARVHALGCGPRPIPRDNMTVHKMTRGLLDLTGKAKYRRAAQNLAVQMRSEGGVKLAADIVEKEIAAWHAPDGKDGK